MTSLITLPIRLPLEITVRAAKLGVDVLRAVTGLLEHDSADERAPWPEPDAAATSEYAQPTAEPIVVEDVIVPEPPKPEVIEATPAPPSTPAHVDSEPEIAYESGPAADVGAEVHVDAPWDGYDQMRASEIVTRLRSADDATRAVVRLYEQQGKARSSILAATG